LRPFIGTRMSLLRATRCQSVGVRLRRAATTRAASVGAAPRGRPLLGATFVAARLRRVAAAHDPVER